jgi:TPR repeat protein
MPKKELIADPALFDTTMERLLGLRKRLRELETRRWEHGPEMMANIEAEEQGAGLELQSIFSYSKQLEKNGDPRVGYQLAMMYRLGEGVKSSYRRAYTALRKGAEAGDPQCALECALCNERSNMGTRVDYQQSYQYYLQAAQSGMPYACERLGWAFFQGGALERELHYPTAYRWFKKAEELGSTVGARMCVTILEKFDADADH